MKFRKITILITSIILLLISIVVAYSKTGELIFSTNFNLGKNIKTISYIDNDGVKHEEYPKYQFGLVRDGKVSFKLRAEDIKGGKIDFKLINPQGTVVYEKKDTRLREIKDINMEAGTWSIELNCAEVKGGNFSVEFKYVD